MRDHPIGSGSAGLLLIQTLSFAVCSRTKARALLLSASWVRESPKPNTQNCGDDKRDPAYAHWNGTGSDGDLGLLHQSHQMTNGKDAENYARDA
jgi:hypothetical protein